MSEVPLWDRRGPCLLLVGGDDSGHPTRDCIPEPQAGPLHFLCFLAIRKAAGLYCGPRLRKGEVFAYVGLPQNLKDLKDPRGASSLLVLLGDGLALERLVIYCQTTGASAAHATHCATYCTPCRPLMQAFSGWIRTPPPTV